MHWPRWNPNQEYHAGDSLEYQGQTYYVIQTHISQPDWTPSQSPALWGLGKSGGSEIGRPSVPQDQHTPGSHHRGGWMSNQEYHIGDSVDYQGQTYHIIQPHISQADWTPPQCPALWGPGKPAGSEIGKPSVPQVPPIPQPYHRGGQGEDRLPAVVDHSRDGPRDSGSYGIPQAEPHRGIPQPEPHRGFPEPDHRRDFPNPDRSHGFPDQDRSRGFPEPDRHGAPPSYTPGDRDHDRDWREKGDDREREREREHEREREGREREQQHERERDRDYGRNRDWEREGDREREQERERERERERDRNYGRDREQEGERERDRDREHRRDREYESRDQERVYEGEDRAMREGHHRSQGDGEYRNPIKYKSSAEWIDDARRRAREVNMNGPSERIFWLLAEPGDIPKHAIQAGEDKEGNPTFVSRNFHEGGLHIGWAGLQNAAISYGGRELPLTTFEVLVGDPRAVRWVASKKRDGRPIEAGYEANGKPLWICQTLVGGQILAGKTATWDSGGYIASEGREQAVPEYNVLCHP